jgi:hypothetical protein
MLGDFAKVTLLDKFQHVLLGHLPKINSAVRQES